MIRRARRTISAGAISDHLANKIFITTSRNEVKIELTDRRTELHIGLHESADFNIHHLGYDERSTRFPAALVPPSGDLTGVPIKVAGHGVQDWIAGAHEGR